MTMKDDAARDVLRRMVEAFRTGDTSAVNSFVADEYVDHQGLRGVQIAGPEGFRRVVQAARSGFEELRVTIEDLFTEDDRAVARIRWVGTRRSDGGLVERETIDIIRCLDNRAVEHWGSRTTPDPA